MPYVPIAGSELQYALIVHDRNGLEKTDDPDGLMSRRVLESVVKDSITDVFLMSHGWKGDIPAARAQYDAWAGVMFSCKADRERARQGRDFRPAVIGFHWPSLPWGDEKVSDAEVAFSAAEISSVDDQVQEYALRIADTPAACKALRTILTSARDNPVPDQLPADVCEAYEVLNGESGLGSRGVGAAPGDDRELFNPQERYQSALEETAVSFGMSDVEGVLLWPLRQLSFWKMKDRARQVGESAGHALLRALLVANREIRIHLMGHSFGSIVVSASIVGPTGGSGLPRPVHSLVLVQGALSLWSYCSDIPFRPGSAGYFRQIIEGGTVLGSILTTRSPFDTAVGKWYPRAAGVAGQIAFAAESSASLPKYGGVGAFGLQGPGLDIVELDLKATDLPYDFKEGRIYNLECSRVISGDGGKSDAHCDIVHPEVAHAVWSAALA